ncbi:MAG: alpha/beta fold hydrolase, partial [Planctomycetota bacterium]|nr:alpha/beta fold hydrolase [Planctomycetota bacterium]
MLRILSRVVVVFVLTFTLGPDVFAGERNPGPWNLDELKQTPAATFGERDGLVQPVWYAGEPFENHATRVFAWYARPEGAGPFPAMVLVHGGGGKAFREWAEHWAKRGYAAIAMDLAGNGPNGRLPDAGPDQSDELKFRDFSPETVRDMWSYHAVADVLRAHSLLAAQPEVDRDRIGVTGISWGGYLTCIVAGIDDRLKVAVPVYGCGNLADNSVWVEPRFSKMTEEHRDRWVTTFDPSKYLPGVSCPILFLNGTNDFAYPLDSYRKCYRLVDAPRTLSIIPRLPHGHIWTFKEVDSFVDAAFKKAPTLPTLTELKLDSGIATAKVVSETPIKEVALHYTTDEGPWQKREWKSVPAELKEGVILAKLPAGKGLGFYLAAIDERGL